MENTTRPRDLPWPEKARSLEAAQAGLQKASIIAGEAVAEAEQAERESRENIGDGWAAGRFQKLCWRRGQARAIEREMYWQCERFLRRRWWDVRGPGKIADLGRRVLRLDEEAELQAAFSMAVEVTDELTAQAERRRADGEGSEMAYHIICDQRDRAVKIERAVYRQVQRFLRRREQLGALRGVGRGGWKVLEAVGKVRKVLRGAGFSSPPPSSARSFGA